MMGDAIIFVVDVRARWCSNAVTIRQQAYADRQVDVFTIISWVINYFEFVLNDKCSSLSHQHRWPPISAK